MERSAGRIRLFLERGEEAIVTTVRKTTVTQHKSESSASKAAHPERDAESHHENPGVTTELDVGDEDKKLDKALMDSFPTSDPPSSSHITGAEVVNKKKTSSGVE